MVLAASQKVASGSLAEWTGLAAFLAAVLLSFVDVRLSSIPLAGFVLLSVAAVFLPSLGYYVPAVSRGTSGEQAVALTFDDGPDPLSTPELLKLLSKHRVPATFFVTGKNASEQPGLVKEIVRQGHSIGNHTYTHDNLMLLKGFHHILNEIEKTQNVLLGSGVIPLVFRPPVGITGPGLRQVLGHLNLSTVIFSCRALDGGNWRIRNLSKTILRRVRPGDIILLHDTRPKDDRLFAYWLNEMEQILAGIGKKGLKVLPLSTIIGRPVMDVLSLQPSKMEPCPVSRESV